VTEVERGLQVERTLLAHRRTQLATAAVSVLLVRGAEPGYERTVAVLVTATAVLLSVLVAAVRGRELSRRPSTVSSRGAVMTLLAVGSLQVLGALLVVA
jgi:hypothetical protein